MTTPQNEAQAPSAPADDLDGLLLEFDRSVPAAPSKQETEQSSAPTQPPAEIPESFTARLLRKAQERDARMRDAARPKDAEPAEQQNNDRLSQLEDFAAGIEAERTAARNKEEAEKVFQRAAEVTAEVAPWLPPEMARAWLLNEVATDGDLQQAWNERHASPEHAMRAERQVNRALRKLHNYAKSLPDPKATNDRELVTAAVRGAAVKPPPERAPDYKSMTDAEFAKELKQKYGIDSTRLI